VSNMRADPEKMHRLYVSLTQFNLEWTHARRWPWEIFCLKFNEDDLRTVINWIKNEKRMGRPARFLTFRNFISAPDAIERFEEDLCSARAAQEKRQKYPPPDPNKARVMQATGRSAEQAGTEQTPSQILERSKLAAMLRGWREQL